MFFPATVISDPPVAQPHRPLLAADGVTTGFIENRGQIHDSVKYYAPGSRVTMYFTPEAVVLDLKGETEPPGQSGVFPGSDRLSVDWQTRDQTTSRGCAIWLRFEDTNPSAVVEARGLLPTRYNFLKGKDPAKWKSGIPAYAEIVYRDLWPGIDLIYRDEAGAITCEVILAEGARGERVSYKYVGAESIETRSDGSCTVMTPVGSFTDIRPVAGQRRGCFSWVPEDGGLPRNGGRSVPLWSTFLGGGSWENCRAVAVDGADNPVVTGETQSPDFPTTPGAYDTSLASYQDVFVAKLDASGSILLWGTYLGGTDDDFGQDLDLDGSDNPVVTGYTLSPDFPATPAAYDTSFNGYEDVFVAKLDASGSTLLWSTRLGGGAIWDSDRGYSIALDSSANPVVTGATYAHDFPRTASAYDTSFNGAPDVFVTKLNVSGSDLIWSTYLGGSSGEDAYALDLDHDASPVLTGYTSSADFPVTPTAYDTSCSGADVFVTKLNASGTALVWSTYLGGATFDFGYGVDHDASRNVAVTGYTYSPDFPTTPAAYDTSFNGGIDAFVSKFNTTGTTLIWSTYLGGTGSDLGYAVLHNASGEPVVAGATSSADFLTTPDALDTSWNGSIDAFVSILNVTGTDLSWSTFLGGSGSDEGHDLTFDNSGNPLVTGGTSSSDFPTTPAAYDTSRNGSSDGFVCKLDWSLLSVCSFGNDVREPMLRQNFPNPFNPATTIMFSLAEQAEVSLCIYDVSGRLVRTLAERSFAAGLHALEWNGQDHGGLGVASGIYFYRLQAPGYEESKKMILLR